MNDTERVEISALPMKYRPLSAWAYFGYTIVFQLPLIGFILLVIFALDSSNINRRSFARSYFCGLLIVIILVAVIILAAGGLSAVTSIIEAIKNGLTSST